MDICCHASCSGCGLCSQVCPKKCIEMKEDCIGHLYPSINAQNCVNCGLCAKSCPANRMTQTKRAVHVYASWAKEQSVRKKSTSGGVAAILAAKFIQDGTVIYGSALHNRKIQHIRITSIEELPRIQGSKYVESPIVEALPQIKEDLMHGRNVAFFGTPCQCAAVWTLSERNANQLSLVELICTGVPPQKLLWEHLKTDAPSMVRFRDETGSRLSVWEAGKLVYQKPFWKDAFLTGFRSHLFFRESCYQCKYASVDRVADITLGDYWGIGKDFRGRHDITDGISVVFVNSEKGAVLFEQIKDKLFWEMRPIEEAIAGNLRYSSCSSVHKDREKFLAEYKKHGFHASIKKVLVKERCKNVAYSIKRCMKKIYVYLRS